MMMADGLCLVHACLCQAVAYTDVSFAGKDSKTAPWKWIAALLL